MGLKRDGVPLVLLKHPWVGTLMVEGIRTEEALGRGWCWGFWGVQAGPGGLGKALRESLRKFLIKTSPSYCQRGPKTGTTDVTLASLLQIGCGRAGTSLEKGSRAGRPGLPGICRRMGCTDPPAAACRGHSGAGCSADL